MRASTDGKQPKDQIEGKNELEEAAATAALRTVDETEAPEPANSENMIELTAEAVMENEAVAGTSDETTVISKTVSQVPTEKSAIIVASSTTAKKEEESNTVSLTEKPQPVERTTLDEELTFAEQYS